MSNLKNTVNPLTWNVPIVNPKDGTPTDEFMRKWAQQAGTNDSIPNLTTAAGLSAFLDLIGLAQGDLLYRDTQLWKVLAPGTLGYVLQTEGPAANPAWAGISAVLDLLGATQGDILYRNATVWTTLAPGSSGQLLSYNASTHAPQWTSESGVVLGSGVPTVLYPAGTLYSRTDAAGVYSSQPTTAPPASIVQRAVLYSNFPDWPGQVVLGGAPTVGNLLLAFVSTSANAVPEITASWTLLTSGGTGSSGGLGFLVYRYVQAGDTATLPAICSAAGGIASWVAEVYEITSVSGTIASDVLSPEAAYNQTATLTTTNMLTTANNQTSLVFANQINQNSNIAISGGWSADDQQHVTASNGPGAWIAAHLVEATSGTNVNATLTMPGSTQANYISVLVGIGGFLVANWVLIGPGAAPPTGANPTATAGPTAVNGSAATFMRSDGAPAVQKASAAQFGIVEVDGTTITAAAGVITAVQPTGANPSATASDTAVNGAANTFMRSDAAPAVQKVSSSVFGLAKVDNKTIVAAAGIISAQLAPVFQAILFGSSQSITAATYTKVLLDTVIIDSGSYWDATNHRYTPQIAGTYMVSGGVETIISGALSLTLSFATIQKNGAPGTGVTYSKSLLQVPASVNTMSMTLPIGFATMNGTTDYLELWGRADSTGGTTPAIGNDQNTALSIVRIGP